MKAKRHNQRAAIGVRDPKVGSQAGSKGGHLVWIENGQPMVWVDRPLKFRAHIQFRLDWFEQRGKSVTMEDIKYRQLAGRTWWRIPEWTNGRAER